MSVIEKLIDLYNILDVDEKKEFMVIVAKRAKEDGIVTQEELSGGVSKGTPIKGSIAKYPSKGGSKLPYWVKEIKDIDFTKKGMFRIVGDWLYVNKPCSEKKLCVLGFKSNHPNRKSYVVGYTHEYKNQIENSKTGYKVDVFFNPIGEYDTFADVEAAASRRLNNE